MVIAWRGSLPFLIEHERPSSLRPVEVHDESAVSKWRESGKWRPYSDTREFKDNSLGRVPGRDPVGSVMGLEKSLLIA